MIKTKLTARDLLLLLLYVDGVGSKINEPIPGKTRLLKMIIVFEEVLFDDFKKDKDILNKEDLPEFFAWNYGPMSTEVLEDLEFFKKIKFIDSHKTNSLSAEEAEEISAISDDIFINDSDEEYLEEEYFLSSIGKKYVEENLITLLTPNQKQILKKLKKEFNNASLDKILKYIYNNPKFEKYIKKDKSKIFNAYKIQ